MSDAELRDPVRIITLVDADRADCPSFWRDPIAMLGVGLLVGILAGLGAVFKITAPPTLAELNQRRAWDINVAAFEECERRFVNAIPRGQIERIRKAVLGCETIADLMMSETWKAGQRR